MPLDEKANRVTVRVEKTAHEPLLDAEPMVKKYVEISTNPRFAGVISLELL